MNAIPSRTSSQIDWVINYVEVNSQPSTTSEFRRLRITSGEIQIDPAGIVLSIQRTNDQGLELQCGSDTYLATITQRGNELVLKLQRSDSTDNVMIVAKRSVSKFDPSNSFTRVPENRDHTSSIEPSSFF